MNRQGIVLALALLMAACTAGAPSVVREPPVQAFAYDCECIDAAVRFTSETSATLQVSGGTAQLERVPSGSGAKYTGQGYTFWDKGDRAILETPDEIYPNCRRTSP